MFIPRNGKVIVLDDKIEQAMPLIQVLSRNKIPFTYYSGDISQLPTAPHDDVRLIFIDINLTDGTNEEAIKSQLQRTITRLIRPNSTYIAAIWSLRENQYNGLLDDLFNARIPTHKPLVRLSLAKSNLFTIDTETGHHIEDQDIDVLEEINQKLLAELESLDSLKVLMLWENIVNDCSGRTINQFSSMVSKDPDWNLNVKHLFYKMAHAQLGQTLLEQNEQQVVQAAVWTLNSSFIDKVEESLDIYSNLPVDVNIKGDGISIRRDINGSRLKVNWEGLKDYKIFIDDVPKASNKKVDKLKSGNQGEQVLIEAFIAEYMKLSPSLNSALLLSKTPRSHRQPGNVYKKVVSGTKKRMLLKTYFKDIDKKDQHSKYLLKDVSDFQFIELECTPNCDYSQRKWLRTRLLPGIIYPVQHEKLVNDIDSLYREFPYFEYKGQIMKLVFDLRLFKSINLKAHIEDSANFLFKIRNEVLTDILAKASSHINRPGIITVV